MKANMYLFYLVVDRTTIRRNRYLINENMVCRVGKDILATLYGWTTDKKTAKRFLKFRDTQSFVRLKRTLELNTKKDIFHSVLQYLNTNFPLQRIQEYDLLLNSKDTFPITVLEKFIVNGKYDKELDDLLEGDYSYIDQYKNTIKSDPMSHFITITGKDLDNFDNKRGSASGLVNKVIRDPKDEFDRWVKYALPTLNLLSILKYMNGGEL